MTYYTYWRQCQSFLEQGDFAAAEHYAFTTARTLNLDNAVIDKIAATTLNAYRKTIEQQMPACVERAQAEHAQAICLYYSLDNGWDSTLYICQDYSSENNDWIAASRSWISLGRARGFAGLYQKHAQSAFYCDNISAAICLMVMFKTTITFWHTIEKYRDCGLKICITCTESDCVRLV